MRFYIKCPQCGGLDLTDVSQGTPIGEVEKLRCNKCTTIFNGATGVLISENNAPSKRMEEFINFLKEDDFKWKGEHIESCENRHLSNIKKFIERNCQKHGLHPMDFKIYQNVLAEIDKRINKE